jgi:hypothetical protein
VVSLLNHYEHKIQEAKFNNLLDAEFEKIGYSPDCIPEFSKEQVMELIQRSPELTKLYNNINGKVNFELKDYILENKDGNKVMGDAQWTHVNLYRTTFFTAKDLFLTVGHELNHVYHNLFLRKSWIGNLSMKNAYTEYLAYKWQYRWDPSSSTLELMNHYQNLSKNIKLR